jgi:hypothetical protein
VTGGGAAARGLQRWRDLAAASDPGWNRLLIGARAAGNVGLGVLVLWAVSTATGQPIAAMLVGLAIATLSAIVIKEERRRDRALTFAASPWPVPPSPWARCSNRGASSTTPPSWP